MNLIKYHTDRDIFGLPNRSTRLMGELLSPGLRGTAQATEWDPVIDIYENDATIVIQAKLPGVHKENMDVEVEEQVLTLRGERSSETETKTDNYHLKEWICGKFERRFALPGGVDPRKITAKHKDGLLSIAIPKPDQTEPRKIALQ